MLQINSDVVNGTKNLEKFADVAGVSAEEFQNLWKDDASEAFTLFVE